MRAQARARTVTVAIQGEPGSFSEEAMRRLVREPRIASFRSFEEVAEAVAGGVVELGLLPASNSLVGPISDLPALLLRNGLVEAGEVMLRIEQCLIAARPVPLDGLSEVRSHPVALEQCRRFLAAHPRMVPHACHDTAGAVREVCAADRPHLAAIAGRAAARLYGGAILVAGIADAEENVTRFVLFERRRPRAGARDRATRAVGPLHAESDRTRSLEELAP